MCHSAEKSEDLIMNQRMNATMCHSADENEDLIISQRMNSTMCHSADESDVNEAMSCLIVKQNDSNTTINVILKVMKIHKFFNLKFFNSTSIFNNIMISSLADYASYFFKNLT
jgi:hypothetical protein